MAPIRRMLAAFVAAAVCHAQPLLAQDTNPLAERLANLSLEELLDVKITSVSKRPQRVADAAAAVHVITRDDIRRSGATSLPELLADVPGMQVDRVSANRWAVGARGFSGVFSNKLLVLVDGRSVYSPLYSGVWWDIQGVPLQDIERIEVIRGPGAALWGANAVAGVINVITREARDVKNVTLQAAVGDEHSNSVYVGGGVGSDSANAARFFAEHTFERRTPFSNGSQDDRELDQAGMRWDWRVSEQDSVAVDARLYRGKSSGFAFASNDPASPATLVDNSTNPKGGHAMVRATRRLSDEGSLTIQAYVDREERSADVAGTYRLDTADIEAQHQFRLNTQSNVVWGAGYRRFTDAFPAFSGTSLDPAKRTRDLLSVFGHGEWQSSDDMLHASLGARLERHTDLGWNVQPNARVLWNLSKTASVWTSASRALRTPSRVELDGNFSIPIASPDPRLPTFLVGSPSPKLHAEELQAFEVGARIQPSRWLTLDATAYRHAYSELSVLGAPSCSVNPLPAGIPALICATQRSSTGEASVRGAELVVDAKPADGMRVRLAQTYSRLDGTEGVDGVSGVVGGKISDATVRNQTSLRLSLDPRNDTDLDLQLRRVAARAVYSLPGYTLADVRVAWRPVRSLELSLAVSNLFDKRHKEFVSEPFTPANEQGRSGWLKASVTF